MDRQLKSFITMSVTAISLLAAVAAMTFTAAAASPKASAAAPVGGARGGQANSLPYNLPRAPLSAACTKLQVTKDVYWVTLDEAGAVDQTVDFYPTGTPTITAAFDYKCMPNRTKLSVVWSYQAPDSNSPDSWTFSYTPKADPNPGTDWDSLFNKDGSAQDDGNYTAEFYLGQSLITTGTVAIGNGGDNGNGGNGGNNGTVSGTFSLTATAILSAGIPLEVEVRGTIVDSASKKPINGAQVVVLNEGVDPQQWLKDGSDSDVYTSATTDSRGEFVLDQRITTDVVMPWIISAKGYQPIVDPHYTVPYGVYNPFVLTIPLVRAK